MGIPNETSLKAPVAFPVGKASTLRKTRQLVEIGSGQDQEKKQSYSQLA
jgi:hypothetical protein